MKKKWILVIAPIMMVKLAYGQPNISGVSGNFISGATVEINGTGFGSKTPAAPVLWDDGTNNTKIDTYYGDYQPTAATEGNIYNMAYRDSSFLSGRGISLPHNNTNYVLAGAHACSNIQPEEDCSYVSGSTVHLLIAIPNWPGPSRPQFYVQYYYRYDPNFDEVCISNDEEVGCYNYTIGGENCKQFNIQNSETNVYPSSWGYMQFCNGDCPDVNDTAPVKLSRFAADGDQIHGICAGSVTYHNSPINGWVQMIWIGDYSNTYDNPTWKLITLPDHSKTFQMDNGVPLTTYETLFGTGYPDNSQYESIAIGTFARVPRYNKGINSFRYFSCIYVDDTWSRVVLANNSDYDSATIIEPQIPSAWEDGSIRATVNIGNLAESGPAYLFVFDADNNHNQIGYSVVGSIPPEAPKNLRIISPD